MRRARHAIRKRRKSGGPRATGNPIPTPRTGRPLPWGLARAATGAPPRRPTPRKHAPESDPTKEPPREVSELGVGCVTCHVTEEGAVLAAARSADSAGEGAAAPPHRVSWSTDFGRVGGCAGCHEFRFPMGHGDEDG